MFILNHSFIENMTIWCFRKYEKCNKSKSKFLESYFSYIFCLQSAFNKYLGKEDLINNGRCSFPCWSHKGFSVLSVSAPHDLAFILASIFILFLVSPAQELQSWYNLAWVARFSDFVVPLESQVFNNEEGLIFFHMVYIRIPSREITSFETNLFR